MHAWGKRTLAFAVLLSSVVSLVSVGEATSFPHLAIGALEKGTNACVYFVEKSIPVETRFKNIFLSAGHCTNAAEVAVDLYGNRMRVTVVAVSGEAELLLGYFFSPYPVPTLRLAQSANLQKKSTVYVVGYPAGVRTVVEARYGGTVEDTTPPFHRQALLLHGEGFAPGISGSPVVLPGSWQVVGLAYGIFFSPDPAPAAATPVDAMRKFEERVFRRGK